MATKASEREKTDQVAPDAPPTTDGPLLDLTDQAVRRMIKLAKKRGYVTYDELNEVLPSEEFSSEQIEDVLGQLSEQGINVVDNEDPEAAGEERAARKDGGADEEGQEAAGADAHGDQVSALPLGDIQAQPLVRVRDQRRVGGLGHGAQLSPPRDGHIRADGGLLR